MQKIVFDGYDTVYIEYMYRTKYEYIYFLTVHSQT